MLYDVIVRKTKPEPALGKLAQLVAELQRRLELIEHKIRIDEQAKLQSYANKIRAIGGNPSDYLDFAPVNCADDSSTDSR
jgi:hypothetical protein